MDRKGMKAHWEQAAPGWAKWEATIADWFAPATEAMFDMARLEYGARVLDFACGAGSQTLAAARQVGRHGHVVANDISESMLDHVDRNARAQGLENVTTLAGAAEELDIPDGSINAAICRLGLMLFAEPERALRCVHRALSPGGRLAAVVFSTPAANPFMARPMQVLLRHAGKAAPGPGKPGIFALGAEGTIEDLLSATGFTGVERRKVEVPLRMKSKSDVLAMMQDAFGAYRAVMADCPDHVRDAAWTEVKEMLSDFETESGFVGPGEVVVASAGKPAH